MIVVQTQGSSNRDFALAGGIISIISGSTLFDTLIVFLNGYFEKKINFDKSQQMTNKIFENVSSMPRVRRLDDTGAMS